MKRPLLSSRLEKGVEALSIIWQTFVLYVANGTLHGKIDNKEKIQILISLCLTGLEELFLSYKVAGIMVKGITGMAIRQGVVEQSQVRHSTYTKIRVEQTSFDLHVLKNPSLPEYAQHALFNIK
jgi:hypothetical protein